MSPDVYYVLDLIETLWADPHVDQVSVRGWIQFAWNEKGFDPVPDTEFVAMVRDCLIAQARKEDRLGPTVDVADGNSLPEESTVLVPVSTIKASCWKIQRDFCCFIRLTKAGC